MSEHRRAVRQRRFAVGRIVSSVGGGVGCMIRNQEVKDILKQLYESGEIEWDAQGWYRPR